MENKQKILSFLKSHKLAVIATSFKDKPEAAVIDYLETENLEIIFSTQANYRKYFNLQNNPIVAFVFGEQENITVQYEGVVKELTRQDFEYYKDAYLKKNPVESKFINLPEIRFFKVNPSWIRYANYNSNEIFELNL